jgi:prolyl oligopeptidase
VHAFSDAENAYARKVLDGLPDRAALHDRVAAALSDASAEYWSLRPRGKTLFAMKAQPPLQQPLIVTLGSVDDLTSEVIDRSGRAVHG